MATCNKCGAEIKPNAKFCTKCGQPVGAPQMNKSVVATCSKCGVELKPNAKFCTKCGQPIGAPQMNKSVVSTCGKCGEELKPNTKFCTKCGQPVSQQNGDKGFITDAVRAVGNFVTGGNLNREIQREQDAAVRQQRRADAGEIEEAQNTARQAEREQRRAEAEAERARERRNQEAIDGVDVVKGKAIWSIQPGEIARKITEREIAEIEQLKGIIISEGCSALIFANGELVSELDSGAYLFYKSVTEEQATLKAAIEKAEKELSDIEKKERDRKRQENGYSIQKDGLWGAIPHAVRGIGRLLFGEKKNERKEKAEKRKLDYDKILRRLKEVPILSVYVVSKRYITMTFGGTPTEDGGIEFIPYKIPTKILDVDFGVSLQLKISDDIHEFATNFLADRNRVTVAQIHTMLTGNIEMLIKQNLRHLDYQREGLTMDVQSHLKAQIQSAINQQLHGIQCAQILQITDSNADFERFRLVERELYNTEQELGYLTRTGEFRNRLEIETNSQQINSAHNTEDLRYALQQINKDQLLHDDELEQFVQLLESQKRIREAKTAEEEYEALMDLKRNRLVKEDDMETLEDALSHNKINREEITQIMRIQSEQRIDDARLKADWAVNDMKQEHEWEREDLARRRNWGIEDEERERAWKVEEEELAHKMGLTARTIEVQSLVDRYEDERRVHNDEYEYNIKVRDNEYEWNNKLREIELLRQEEERNWQREREKEDRDHTWARQDKQEDANILNQNADAAMQRLLQMQASERETEAQRLTHEENIRAMESDTERARIAAEVNMTQEQIAAAHMKDMQGLDATAQVAMANMIGSGKENELLQKQQTEQAALYQQMIAMQQNQGTQNQAMMMEMARMMQQGMIGASQNNMANQQQRLADQMAIKNEYRENMQYQQNRMDHIQDIALGSMAGVSAAAASNLSTSNVNIQTNSSINQSQAQLTCPNCGNPITDDDVICGECGTRLKA